MPQFLTNVPAAGTPVPLCAGPKNCQWVTFIACKTLAGPTGGANTGKVQLGFSSTNGQQPMELAPGATFQVFVASGGMLDLSQYWVNAATNGDGVVTFYQ